MKKRLLILTLSFLLLLPVVGYSAKPIKPKSPGISTSDENQFTEVQLFYATAYENLAFPPLLSYQNMIFKYADDWYTRDASLDLAVAWSNTSFSNDFKRFLQISTEGDNHADLTDDDDVIFKDYWSDDLTSGSVISREDNAFVLTSGTAGDNAAVYDNDVTNYIIDNTQTPLTLNFSVRWDENGGGGDSKDGVQVLGFPAAFQVAGLLVRTTRTAGVAGTIQLYVLDTSTGPAIFKTFTSLITTPIGRFVPVVVIFEGGTAWSVYVDGQKIGDSTDSATVGGGLMALGTAIETWDDFNIGPFTSTASGVTRISLGGITATPTELRQVTITTSTTLSDSTLHKTGYTVYLEDDVILPINPNTEDYYIIKSISGTNTVNGNGKDIDTAGTKNLAEDASIPIKYDGTKWRIL